MGFYSRAVFPRLCEFFLRQSFVAKHRRRLLAAASGEVLEIGFGTGLNLPCYPKSVRKLTIVDPNIGMHALARSRIQQSSIIIDQHVVGGEALPFADDAFDCAVSTFTLCSIDHVTAALAEVRRVLKPGGCFLFLEHGLSPDPMVQRWQRRLNWLEMRLADGCRLDRAMKNLVTAEPFAAVRVEEFYLENTPRTHGYLYCGVAVK